MQRIQSLQEQDARREASSDAATPRRARRERTATERAGDEGVWIAALFAAFVSFTVPAWFLGVGLSLAKGTELASTSGLQIAQIVTLGLGAIAVGLGVRSAWVLARAPRLASGAHGGMMPKLALACGILALVFLHRLLTADAAGGPDLLALIGAAAPALLLAETSFAIPTITRGRYGASIGTPGGGEIGNRAFVCQLNAMVSPRNASVAAIVISPAHVAGTRTTAVRNIKPTAAKTATNA